MNKQFPEGDLAYRLPPIERLMGRKWTVAEIEALCESGEILEDERFELIKGEVVPMAAKGNRHELLKAALNRFWLRRLPKGILHIPETTFRLSPDTFLEPDFVLYGQTEGLVKLNGGNALLAVEVSDTSLGYDRGRKALLYAEFGIRELWVIDAVRLRAHVHRRPGPDGYEDVLMFGEAEAISPECAPSVALRLGRLRLI